MAWPVLRQPDSRLFGSEIVGRHVDPFIAIGQFESPRRPGVYTQPATDYLGAAVAALTGDGVTAYNAVVLATFPLAALFAYLLALRLARSRLAGWLAGLSYAFAPYHVAHAAYHPHGAQIQWLPLYLLSLWLSLEKASPGRLLLVALTTALTVLSNYYHGLIVVVVTPLVLVGFWWTLERRHGRSVRRNLLKTAGTLAGILVAGLAYVLVFARPVVDDVSRFAFPRGDLQLYGARWWSYLVPPVEHPLFGDWASELWQRSGLAETLEQQLTLGFGFVLLAVLALWSRLRGERGHGLDAVPALAALGVLAFLFSLAPRSVSSVWPPSGLVYEVLPMFRAYARFGLVVFLVTALLAAIGAAQLFQRHSRSGTVIALLLLGMAAVELGPFPPLRWRDVLPTKAHRWLEGRPGTVRAIDCVPSGNRAEDPAYLRSRHSLTLPTGNTDCGDPDFALARSSEGHTHLLVRRASPFGGWLGTRPAPVGTRPVGSFDDALLYEIEGEPAGLFLDFTGGFHWREYRGNGSFRWMSGEGRLRLVNRSERTVAVGLELDLHAFPGPRRLAVTVDREPVAELDVGIERESYSIDPLTIAPGSHLLALRSRSPPVVPDAILGNGDLRELTVAVWGWRWSERRPAG